MKHDIHDVRPNSINHLVGNSAIMEQVRVALDAAHMDGTPFPHALAKGYAGTGKTQLAHVIADEMATAFIEVLGQNLSNAAQLNQFLLSATDRAILFIDEAHETPKSQQTSLLLALDQKKVIFQGNNGPQAIPLPDFTLILASTDEWGILSPLVSRMRLVLPFQFYTSSELTTLLQRRASSLGWDIESGVVDELSKRAKGIPRQALRLLQSSRMVSRSEGQSVIRRADMERAFALEGIDDLGLGPVERSYLERLLNGPARLNVVSSALGQPSRTISQTVEPLLIRLNLITKTNSGARELTKEGRDHLASNRPILV